MNATTHANKKRAAVKTQLPRELAKALSDCRDLAIHRLQLTFAAMFDRISDVLMERASNSDIRAEQSLFLDARGALKTERAALMSEFETRLRRRIDDRIAGREERQEFASSDIDPSKLTLVDTTAMLLKRAGRIEGLGGRYAALMRQRAGALLGAPQGLQGEALDRWLDSRDKGEAHGFTARFKAANDSRTLAAMHEAAEELHDWTARRLGERR